MKTVAYLRVSTRSQDLANQKLAILEFSQKRRFPIDRFIESRISSRQSPLERRIEELLAALEPGDRLLVSELSRLGRSLSQVIQIVDTLVHRKIRFIAIKEGIEFDGKQDLRTKVMIALFGLFAEVERDLISERTKEGLARREGQGEAARTAQGGLGNIQARRQGARHPGAAGQGSLKGLDRQDPGRLPLRPLPLHRDPQDRSGLTTRLGTALCCISTPIWALPFVRSSGEWFIEKVIGLAILRHIAARHGTSTRCWSCWKGSVASSGNRIGDIRRPGSLFVDLFLREQNQIELDLFPLL